MARQSHRSTFTEAVLNTASGFVLSITFTILYHHAGFGTGAADDFGLVGTLTFVSVARSYVWRRVFNYWLHRKG